MLDKILVAIDESYASQCAFETALKLADALDAELLLVHVLDIFSSEGPGNPFVEINPCLSEHSESKRRKKYEARMTEFISRYDALLKEKQTEAKVVSVDVNAVQPYGRPGPAICKAASENDVDLIVIGNRDRSTLKELVPGSVSNYVVHRAPCSVTVVHPDSYDKAKSDASHSEFALAEMS